MGEEIKSLLEYLKSVYFADETDVLLREKERMRGELNELSSKPDLVKVEMTPRKEITEVHLLGYEGLSKYRIWNLSLNLLITRYPRYKVKCETRPLPLNLSISNRELFLLGDESWRCYFLHGPCRYNWPIELGKLIGVVWREGPNLTIISPKDNIRVYSKGKEV